MTIYTIICKNYVDKQRYNFRLFVLIHLSTSLLSKENILDMI